MTLEQIKISVFISLAICNNHLTAFEMFHFEISRKNFLY